MGKPVVQFGELFGWADPVGPGSIRAVVGGVKGHPFLGEQETITTSRVERIGYSDSGEVSEIETRNTIYRREDA